MRHEPKFSHEVNIHAMTCKVGVAKNAVNLCQSATDAAKLKNDKSYIETLPALRAAKCALLRVELDLDKMLL